MRGQAGLLFFLFVGPVFVHDVSIVLQRMFHRMAAGFHVGEGAEKVFLAGSKAGGLFLEILFELFFFRAELFGPLFPVFFASGFAGFQMFPQLFAGFGNALFQQVSGDF